jgi:hypothetical protein
MKQTKSQKRIVRQIHRFLSTHEYESGYVTGRDRKPLKLHKCDGYIGDYLPALSRKGIVLAYGGGCFIERFALYPANTLNQLLKSAKKIAKINSQNSNTISCNQ